MQRLTGPRTFHDVTVEPTDQTLWRRVIVGDGDSFGVIFDRHRSRVRRHAHGLVPNPEDAEDVVAVVFLEAWRRRARVRFVDGSVLPWLLRTATNIAYNHTRSARRYARALARLPVEEHAPDHADSVDDGAAIAATRSLPLPHQEVIVLCVIEGLSPAEAGHVLGVADGTVRSRLSRAKAQLREALPSIYLDNTRFGEDHA